jgi:hypothetical protein
MSRNLLFSLCLLIFFTACVSSSHNSSVSQETSERLTNTPMDTVNFADRQPISLTDLSRTEDGAFVLAPGYYEAEFKTYCLQPGTPDPSPRDAYLQAPLNGYRKDIVQTILHNSRSRPAIPQRNVQLLLWSVVSGSDFNKLSPAVQSDARQLLTAKQIFELKGGVVGLMKTVAQNLPGDGGDGHHDVRRIFDLGTSSYEAVEKLAVLREPSRIKRQDFKNDQWYQQPGGYYVRHFPVSYQKIRIQVYVPNGVVDASGKAGEDYLVFDPTGLQAIPANSNAQRLGIGGPLLDIVKKVIQINKRHTPSKRLPENKKAEKVGKITT